MSAQNRLKRRQLLLVGGTGVVGFLGGGAITAEFKKAHNSSSIIQKATIGPLQNNNSSSDESYLNPGTFNQQFLTKKADIKQIWDFATSEQVQSDGGFGPVKNAMNALQFIYKKSLYPVICLRGIAVIYALNDAMWQKYDLGVLQKTENTVSRNPVYQRFTTDNGTLDYQDQDSFYQDSSLQALVQRGSSIAVCHDALNGVSSTLAAQKGLAAQIVFRELAAHLVAGTQQTPSGSSLIAVAQLLGFTYATQ